MPMSTVLEGKAALVTGAAGGIGSAVVRAFAEAGAQVLGVDRVEADYVCDVTRSDEVELAWQFVFASTRFSRCPRTAAAITCMRARCKGR